MVSPTAHVILTHIPQRLDQMFGVLAHPVWRSGPDAARIVLEAHDARPWELFRKKIPEPHDWRIVAGLRRSRRPSALPVAVESVDGNDTVRVRQ